MIMMIKIILMIAVVIMINCPFQPSNISAGSTTGLSILLFTKRGNGNHKVQ